MHSNHIPLNDIGGTGIFKLMAETFARQSEPGVPPRSSRNTHAPLPTESSTGARDMDGEYAFRRTADFGSEAGRMLLMSGVWLRIGFVGAAFMAIALFSCLAGDIAPLFAVALAVGGGAIVALGWRKTQSALNRLDEIAADTSPVSTAWANAHVQRRRPTLGVTVS